MNERNSTSKNKDVYTTNNTNNDKNKTRKKREELSISASKSIKKEEIKIVVNFD